MNEGSVRGTTGGPPPMARQHQRDWFSLASESAMWLVAASFGLLLFVINGGFSVAGLGQIAGAFNAEGVVFWATISSLTFSLPVEVPGLSTAQPIIPWLGVVAATTLQITTIYWRRIGRAIPARYAIATVALSVYDLGTTYAGAGTMGWIANAGILVQVVIAVIVTFAFEVTVGFLIRAPQKRS